MAAKKKKAEPLIETGNRPLPESGERIINSPSGSKFRKPVPAMTHEEAMGTYGALGQRAEWEHSEVGRARTTGIDPGNWMGTGQRAGANLAQIYHMKNYDVPEDKGPRVYDRQLPGMADPSAAPRPANWHEMTDAQRAHTERSLLAHGTSIQQMAKDIGAQLDQAHMRAWKYGESAPYASRFYEQGDEHRDRLDQSAHTLGISPLIHAQMNAFTSPNSKFAVHSPSKPTKYPNDDAAMHAVRWAQMGEDPKQITTDLADTGTGNEGSQSYRANLVKASSAMTQHLAGVAPADWKFGPKGEGDGFSGSPKTGPYANSWSDSHPQFTVGDIHTGGGGGFPHLSSAKPILRDAEGNERLDKSGLPRRDKSQREKAIERVPFSHAAVDQAMEMAMGERNLGSKRRAQAAQWGEEQLQRGEAGQRDAPKADVVYRRKQSQFDPNQGAMFGADEFRTPAPAPAKAEAVDKPTRRPGKPAFVPDASQPDERSDTAKRMGIEF